MGNSQHRYITSNEASEIIGADTWNRLRAKLERGTVKTIDFALFCNIVQTRFERIPVVLCECLFRAFTADFHQKLEIELFLSSFAVLYSQDLGLKKRFLFRVYETPTGGSGATNSASGIERKRMEEILHVAYGDRLKGRYNSINKFLDTLFQKKKDFISKTKFEQWQGRLDLLSDWIIEVLSVFSEPLPPRLLSLQRKYSSSMEAEMLIQKHNISLELYQRLYHLYLSHCQVTFKPELILQQWLAWVSPDYLSKEMASILFAASTESFKPTWRFLDFAEFALVYGAGSLQTRASAITSAFLKYAVISHAQKSDKRKSSLLSVKPVSLTSDFNESITVSDAEFWKICSKNPDFEEWITEALTYMVYLLCQPIEVNPCTSDYSSPEDYYPQDEAVSDESLMRSSLGNNHISSNTPSASTDRRRRSYSLNLSAEPSDKSNANFRQQLSQKNRSENIGESLSRTSTTGSQDTLFSLDLKVSQEELERVVSPPVLEALKKIYLSTKQSADSFVDLIIEQAALLPVMRDVSITASALFGVEPQSPTSEKEFITELTLRYLKLYPPSQHRPYGPVGTEWYIVPKQWIDSWRMFVGKNRVENPESMVSSASPINGRKNHFSPGIIDNWALLKKSGAKALLPDLVIGQDFEVVPPAVYGAFSSWYGGGPAVSRRVVFASGSDEITEIEFYPMVIVIVECDHQGKVCGQPREMLFSKSTTIQEMISELSLERKLDPAKIRLWNYAKPHWKDQYILSPELTLAQANLADGQVILLESSQSDGSWPRSLLHAYLDSEEKQRQEKAVEGNETEDEEVTEEEVDDGFSEDSTGPKNQTEILHGRPEKKSSVAKKSESSQSVMRRNNGLVGMDNLGNTCYLNSSLQALLHTDLLMEYFLTKSFIRDINVHNKHGFGGRVANIFGKIVQDLWTTDRPCITPRYFYNEVAALRDQFAGNEQHDAHELLAFLLDALSEDLNLVHTKPYTIQPDSDGRADEELANIWWENHLKRDRSVIQALFTGQFKSIMTCSQCGYSSARFEPFNFLTVPIPEDTFRVMIVIVVPRKLEETARVAVRIPKTGVVEDIVEKVCGLGFEGLSPPDQTSTPQYFVAGELVNSRIKSFINLDRRIDTIRDNELLVVFHVSALPKKMDKYYANKYKTLRNPSPTDNATAQPVQRKDSSVDGVEESSNDRERSSVDKGEFSSNSLALQSNDSDNSSPTINVRVAFSQRRTTFVEGAYSGVAGFDFFRLEPFGMPILEVLPSKVRGSDLYKLMHRRLAGYYKGTIKGFVKNQLHLSSHSSYISGPSISATNPSPKEAPSSSAIHARASKSENSNLFSLGSAAADTYEEISPITTEEVVAGPIPTRGFTLRLITGGTGATVCCSRCPWINRCQGCILPDADDVEYELLDGESIAVDWHYVVFEDLLDTQLASSLTTHPSVAQEKAFLHDTKVPLSKCLDKFNELETLDGVICPKCHEENTLRKSFMLWRLPPVLIIQLKRFQFDRTSRRKLNNRIDFPLVDLDLTDYIAPSRLEHSNTSLCNEYDLYSVIHHIGALGGGHYVNTTRFDHNAKTWTPLSHSRPSQSNNPHESFNRMTKKFVKSIRALASASSNGNTLETFDSSHHQANSGHNGSTGATTSSNLSSELPLPSDPDRPDLMEKLEEQRSERHDYHWYSFNDNIVNEVSDLSDINSPSAYVLFYLRKDLQNNHDIQSLLRTQLMLSEVQEAVEPADLTSHNKSTSAASENEENSSASVPQPPPREDVSAALAKTKDKTDSPSASSSNIPRRHQYILSKKQIPSKTSNSDGNVQTRSRNPYSSQNGAAISSSSKERRGEATESEADNNCLIS